MRFLAPAAFWFAATIPVVIVFYLLKRKRVVQLVSSTLLWQKFLAETQASAPFQKLRHNWLLVLQLLLLILVILSLSRPYFANQTNRSHLRVVILDASASMQCTDETPSRFEKARAEALKWVASLRDNDQMVILQAAAHTEVKQSPTSEKAALRRALEACSVTDGPTRLIEAFKMAESLVRDRPDAEIHLFSDGALPNLGEFENKNLPLVFHQVGQRRNNLGIVSLDVRPNPEDANQRAIFTSLVNQSTNKVQTELELHFDGQLLETRSITLGTNETSPQVFVATQTKDGVFTVRLTAKDDLGADNQASIVSLLPQPLKVLLVGRGNRFLEKALNAVGRVELSTIADLTDPAEAFDVVVVDDLTPTRWPSKNLLAIHTAQTNWFDEWSKIEAPPIVDWKSTHPLLRFVGFDNVHVTESLAVKTPSWANAIVDSPKTPLILAGELSRQRIVWVGFDTLQSDWPLRISFPIFIANAVDWLNPASANSSQLMVRAGDPFRLGLVQSIASAQMIVPDGAVKALPVDTNAREIVFGETEKQGIYRLKYGTNETVFCVNAIDAAESDTAPRAELPFGKYGKVTATTLRRANMELWRWVAMAGLIVLMFEMVVLSSEDGVSFSMKRFSARCSRARSRPSSSYSNSCLLQKIEHEDEGRGTRTKSIALSCCIFVLLLATGCSRTERPVVIIYTSQDQVYAEPILQRFKEKTGIEVRALYDSEAVKTVGLANRLLAERGRPRSDLFWSNEELRTRQLASQNIFREDTPWRSVGYRSRRMVINTNLLSMDSAPRRFSEVTNAVWRGKVALAYPLFGTTATHFLALRQTWGDARWQAWCRALQQNKPFLVDGNSVVVKLVGQGEAWIGFTDSDDVAAGQREGLPVVALDANEETLIIPNTVAVIRNAPHPIQAQKLFDYLQDPEVLETLITAKALEKSFLEDTSSHRKTLAVDWDSLLKDIEPATTTLKHIFLR